jgi:hypothetical protein
MIKGYQPPLTPPLVRRRTEVVDFSPRFIKEGLVGG